MARMIKAVLGKVGRRFMVFAARRALRRAASVEAAESAAELLEQAAVPPRRPALLRWSYVLTRGTMVAAVWIFFAFGFDPLLRVGVQSALQRQLGAKAEIDTLRTKVFPPAVCISGLRLADPNRPGTNLFECAALKVKLDGDALLRKAFVVDDGEALAVHWNTLREDSGLLAPNSPSRHPGAAGPVPETLETLGRVLGKELAERAKQELNPKSLESVRLAEQLKTAWQQDFDELEARINEVKPRLDAIREQLERPRGNVLEQVSVYRKAAIDAKRLLQEIDQLRRETEGLPAKARADLQRLDEAKERDIERLKKTIALARLDPQELSEFFFGPRLGPYVAEALQWLRWSRPRNHEQPAPPRARGRWVTFPRKEQLPGVLVRRLRLSGRGDIAGADVTLSGSIRDLASDPRLYGRPMILELAGRGEADLHIKLVLDHTGATPKQHVQFLFAQEQSSRFTLGRPELLELAVTSQSLRWELELRLDGERLAGELRWRQDPVQIEPTLPAADGQPEITDWIRQTVADVREVEATLVIGGTWAEPTFQVRSNLGPVLAEGLTSALDRLVQSQQRRLVAQLERNLTIELTRLTSRFNDRYAGLLRALQDGQHVLDEAAAKISRSPLDRLLRR
ncbi:MAG TPA: TIGR03545 family protein [Planctomycetaceae bacterium]|nr:TIGR03545 family protein [Planctomycetaceae bacterium]